MKAVQIAGGRTGVKRSSDWGSGTAMPSIPDGEQLEESAAGDSGKSHASGELSDPPQSPNPDALEELGEFLTIPPGSHNVVVTAPDQWKSARPTSLMASGMTQRGGQAFIRSPQPLALIVCKLPNHSYLQFHSIQCS